MQGRRASSSTSRAKPEIALSEGSRAVVAVAPRLFSGLMDAGDRAPLGAKAWGEARLVLPLDGEFEHGLTGEHHRGSELRVAALLAAFPAALLVRR